jgi:hypothetical protein
MITISLLRPITGVSRSRCLDLRILARRLRHHRPSGLCGSRRRGVRCRHALAPRMLHGRPSLPRQPRRHPHSKVRKRRHSPLRHDLRRVPHRPPSLSRGGPKRQLQHRRWRVGKRAPLPNQDGPPTRLRLPRRRYPRRSSDHRRRPTAAGAGRCGRTICDGPGACPGPPARQPGLCRRSCIE